VNILQINTADRGGGAEGSALGLFQRYRELGHGSWLAVGRNYSNDPDVLEIPRLPARGMSRRLLQMAAEIARASDPALPGARRLARCLDRLASPQRLADWRAGREEMDFPGCRQILKTCPAPPDVIHCHNLHGWYFDLRILPELSRQAPLILNLRDTWTMTGHCAYFMDCNRWKSGCGQCPRLDVYPACRRDATAGNWRRKAEIYAATRLHVTAPSQWLVDQARQSMLKATDYKVIPNGIDTTVFRPGDQPAARRELGLPTTTPIVMFAAAARHSVFKDPQTLQEAIRLTAARMPDLLFVCVGMKNPIAALRQVNLRCVPFVSQPRQLASYYQAADVFVHTAKAEAFGKTITEAMACGTPVAATAVGGIPEQIIDGETGSLCSPGNPQELAAKIIYLLSDRPENQLHRRVAAAQRGQEFSLQRQTEAFLDWYEELRRNHPRRTT
jgi:glycosyltransferase involved in cell wall biosynthesis